MLKGRALGLLQGPIERKLSAMLGAAVTFDKLDVSLLGGSVEATGVTVAGHDPAVPLLTIRKVRAEVSLGAALKKEFVVKSLTIEKPIVTVVRGLDGTLNLPRRKQGDDTSADASANPRRTADAPADTAATDDAAGTWKFEAQKVLVVDGEVRYRDAAGYHASVEQLLAEVKDAGEGTIEFTLIADSAGRRDEAVELGQIRANGRADNVPSLAQWKAASVRASVELADTMRIRADVPSVNPLDVKAELNGTADLGQLARLLPKNLPAGAALRAAGVRGRVEVLGRATYRAGESLRVPELTLRAADVILSAARTPA